MSDRSDILARMEQVMGPVPSNEQAALDMRVVETVHRRYSRFLKISLAVGRDDGVSAWLSIPHDLPQPAPAVVCLHQTTQPRTIGKDEPAGFAGKPDLYYAQELADQGYITISPDYPNFGEYAVDCYAMGYASAMRKAICNHMRSVDLLLTLPEVDPKRIGCIGHSRGGHGALFLAAFDQRVCLAVSSCGFTRFVDDPTFHFWSRPVNMPLVAERFGNDPRQMPFDFPDVLCAIAPRPMFINAPSHDVMTLSGVKACLRAAERTYQKAGKSDHLEAAHPVCAHEFPDEVRRQAYAFMARFLKPQVAFGTT